MRMRSGLSGACRSLGQEGAVAREREPWTIRSVHMARVNPGVLAYRYLVRRNPIAGERGHAALAMAALAVFLLLSFLLAGWGPWGGWGMMGDGFGGMRAMHGGADTSASAAVQGGKEATVEMRDTSFRPGNLVVAVGAKVTWVNRDSVPHDAASLDGAWATRILNKDETATLTFDTAGEYDYSCRIHPTMRAKLTVVASGS